MKPNHTEGSTGVEKEDYLSMSPEGKKEVWMKAHSKLFYELNDLQIKHAACIAALKDIKQVLLDYKSSGKEVNIDYLISKLPL